MSNEEQKNLESNEQEQKMEEISGENVEESQSNEVSDETSSKDEKVTDTENKEIEDSQAEAQAEEDKVEESINNSESKNSTEANENESDKKSEEITETEVDEIKSEEESSEKEEVKEENQEDKSNEESNQSSEPRQKTARQRYFDEIFAELKGKMEKDEIIEVEVQSRIRGGLRVHYKDIPLFLPTSHFSLKRNPSEEELSESIGKKFEVNVHEYQEFDEGRKAVIVSRRRILTDKLWERIKIGEIIEGKVSSVSPFGVFVEFEGVEGLIHISRLSRVHVKDPKTIFNKGDDIKAKIIDIDKSKNKIALSHKEVEESLWKGVEEEFKAGDKIKGIVRRLTEFGAYVELKPGVDGLLRNNELSWTRRIKRPNEILKEGQEIEVEILSISEEKEKAALSYRRTQPNPWYEIEKKYPIGSEYEATIMQVIPQGAIVNLDEGLDGFMPRSKMRPVMKNKKIPYKSGDKTTVIIVDINPDEESLILEPKVDESQVEKQQEQKKQSRKPKGKSSNSNSFSLGDLLSDTQMDKLKNMND